MSEKPDSHILYLVFIENTETHLKISDKEKELIRKAAEEIYSNNGINMNVSIISADGFFDPKKLGLMSSTDRITYLGDTGSFKRAIKDAPYEMSVPNPGWTDPNTGEGYYNYTDWLNVARGEGKQIPINWEGYTKQLTNKYKYLHYNKKNPYRDPVDYITWIARDALHEGGGHAELGAGHSNEKKCNHGNDCGIPERYGEGGNSSQNIMLKGGTERRTPFPKEMNPDVLKFLPADQKIIQKKHPYYFDISQDPFLEWIQKKNQSSKIAIIPKDEFSSKLNGNEKTLKKH